MCAMPAKVKTWTIDPCNRETVASVVEAIGDCFLGIKNALKLMSGVSVKGSCNGTTGAMDGTDRWTVTGDVQTRVSGGAGAHSWIVLNLDNMGGAELLISYSSAAQQAMNLYYSPGGNYVAAGTPSHKPTATDEVTIASTLNNVTSGNAADRLWSTWTSSDGAAFMFGIAEGGTWQSFVAMQQLTSRVTAATLQAGIVVVRGGASMQSLAGASWGSGLAVCRVNTTNLTLKLGSEAYGTSGPAFNALTSIAELQGSGHNVYPVSAFSDTSPLRGPVGNFIDLWCGNVNAADGDTYPNDTSRLYVQISDLVVPWDGSVVAMT